MGSHYDLFEVLNGAGDNTSVTDGFDSSGLTFSVAGVPFGDLCIGAVLAGVAVVLTADVL